MAPLKTKNARTPAEDRADMFAAPAILVAMLLLVISVLRPQMADAPASFVVLALLSCALLFITMLAMFFEKDRFGVDRWLLAGVSALLLVLGLVYRPVLTPTLIATACGIPAASCMVAWVILRNGRRLHAQSHGG